jgi:hypothetical protein
MTKESRSQAEDLKKAFFMRNMALKLKGFTRFSDETSTWTKKLLWRIGKKACEKQLYAMA